MINGVSVNMMVDTGASLIALPAADATRIGLNYKAVAWDGPIRPVASSIRI
jgi:predicted aspartyl protease